MQTVDQPNICRLYGCFGANQSLALMPIVRHRLVAGMAASHRHGRLLQLAQPGYGFNERVVVLGEAKT
jgi:hypothetical protein